MMTTFLDKPVEYWVEMQRRIDKEHSFEVRHLLQEIVELRGKIGLYEARIKEMATIMEKDCTKK